MSKTNARFAVSLEQLRWRLDVSKLSFETTEDLPPLKEIIGQDRGVEAFRFGINIEKPGYNVFVTGTPGSGRMSTVQKLLEELSKREGAPDDLCYVNCFKNSETPSLLRFKAGRGAVFKKDVKTFVDTLKKDIPELFESQEYVNTKKKVMEAYEQKAESFSKSLNQKVKDEGFALVDVQAGPIKRPELMPIVDEKPIPIHQLEEMVEKGRFPKEEFENLKQKHAMLREQIDHIFLELRDLQREVKEKIEAMDRAMFIKTASDLAGRIFDTYRENSVKTYIEAMIEDISEHLNIFMPQPTPQIPGLPIPMPEGDPFQSYHVNLLVDNTGKNTPPVIIEQYPTYRNIFGGIERVVRGGVWQTDYMQIKAGSLIRANGGYLVFNLTVPSWSLGYGRH